MTRTRVVPERGLPMINIGVVFISFNEVGKQLGIVKIFDL